ncbi:hypothetical protein M408DRAFT_327519 [Serendipita vermifera MAFF 305830]|uniref:YCII-related domain-containing protein n=1 Tax=Serendipita vermifera MAFF 305830 TaxID=933852 RepID=A0A0C3BGH9_SERVB|nr:hypothetical protein M408DRAFT_327519 [Serendipita vermifera MAFF 305830]
MATTPSSNLQLFIIWAPDYTDDGAFSRRMDVRAQHLVVAEESRKKGYITKISGPYLTPESIATPDAPKKLIGSMLLVRAKSLEEVRANVESDVYWTNNVWDKEKLVIAPFMVDPEGAAV